MADIDIDKRFDIHEIAKNKNADLDRFRCTIYCCHSTGCKSSGSDDIISLLQDAIEEYDLKDKVRIVAAGCMGLCAQGPLMRVEIKGQKDVLYKRLEPLIARLVVAEHVVPALKLEDGETFEIPEFLQQHVLSLDLPFFTKQEKVVLKLAGHMDPEDIHEYIAHGGYLALEKVLKTMTPAQVVDEIKKSGLRGRGGGGFSTGMKWELATKVPTVDEKFIICNGDEGDPGAYMDRSILEANPHAVIEGMMIAAYAIGATEGWFYIRAEYPLAINRLKKAIEQARAYGLLGDHILGTDFSFDIEIRYGAGAFVCGEETALIHSMEGKRGEPTLKPPFPAESGYLGKPTNVNNVETLANIPIILTKGAEWFASIGTERSKGTKVFALAGKINNVGLIEVPMGTTLREVIYEIGGGIKGGKKFKAVQTGGPSGGCLTEKHLDTPIDFDNLLSAGSMMGSGGMIVMDEDDCMVSVARFYLDFTVEESCGKCTPCRIGNKRLLELLNKITEGKGTEKDLDTLATLGQVIKDTALCGLGQTSPNPVLSTLDNFYDEYMEHVRDKTCRAKQCKSLLTYTISPERCIGCHLCAKNCPADAISGLVRKPHVIAPDKCIKCGMCMARCKFNAILVC